MITEFDPSTARDFRQRYEGTIGWVITPSKRELLVVVENVNDRRVILRDVMGFDYTITANSGVAFKFQQIQAGWYPYKDSAAYMWRVPASRNWQRGISSNNTRIVQLDDHGRASDLPVDLTTLAELLVGTQSPCVLSSNFYLAPSGSLFVHREKIGVLDKATGNIKLNSEMFVQEINDIIRRKSLPYKASYV